MRLTKDLITPKSLLVTDPYFSSKDNWILGPILLLLSVNACSSWMIYQTWGVEDNSGPLSLIVMLFMVSTQGGVVAFIFERSPAERPHRSFKLFIYAYSGIMCSALLFFVQSCCIKKIGPLFDSEFSPLCMGARIITEPIILHVDIHVGNVVGIIIVTYALYLLFWGQGKDIITIAKILHFINEGNERKEDEEKAKMKDLANHIGEEGKVEMKIFAIPNIQEGFFDDEQGEMVEMNIATNKKLDEWLLGATIDCFED